MVRRLKENSIWITADRLAILEVLAASREHPSARMIHEDVKPLFGKISLGHIDSIVNALKEVGEVLELNFGEAGNRFDGNRPYPHPHLVCTQCKTVVDVDAEPSSEVSEQVAEETGYKDVSTRFDFFGICPSCQQNTMPVVDQCWFYKK